MKKIYALVGLAILSATWPRQSARAAEPFPRWTARVDLGGTIPQNPSLTEFGGPVSGEKLELDPGFQCDVAVGYRITPWLEVGPEFGFTLNGVDSIGGWSYPDTSLDQILLMANVRVQYPPESRLAPFVGAGVGGVASFLTFGESDYYCYCEPAGTGSDFVLGFQVFGGLRYRVADDLSLGVVYRYLATDRQHWGVEWWDGTEFGVSVDSVRLHSVCLVFSGRF